MKRLKRYLRVVFLAVLVFLTTTIRAQEATPRQLQEMDSVEIGLLTCSPGKEIYSLYGHTAIRVRDAATGQDVAVNYGLFNYHTPHFIPRFVFGLCDYEMGIYPFDLFMEEYTEEGRGVIEQRINLTRQEKIDIINALALNARPENKVYRYNFFYDNCSSRARDMIVDHIRGHVGYRVNASVTSSYRMMVHQWDELHPWDCFGCDLLLGVNADRQTTLRQQQFLPDSLRASFATAKVFREHQSPANLVDSTWTVLEAQTPETDLSFFDIFTPRVAITILTLLVVLASVRESRKKRIYWGIDLALLLVDGLAGLVLFLMIFSKHPTVSLNLQILLLNPLSLVALYSVAKKSRRGQYSKWWTVFAVCILLFFIGNILQDYASGMNILALCLLDRCIVNYAVRFKGNNVLTKIVTRQ